MDTGRDIHGCHVTHSLDRDKPLNRKFVYKIIVTDFSEKRVVSVSSTISEVKINKLCNGLKDKSLKEILQMQQFHDTGYRISLMYRMTLSRNKSYVYDERSIKTEYLSNYKKYVIRENGDIVSYCKISDIDYGYGNIVVWTDEKYRRRGYARELLHKIIDMCKLEGIEPIFLVDSQNLASIELAKSVGFEVVQTEIVGCYIIN